MTPLVDAFGRAHAYLRISVTDHCNLRCTYCMPPGGIRKARREQILRFHEIERLARLFVRLGVKKIRLTGGEPLVRKDIEGLVEDLARIPGLQTLAMTTNGVLLEKYAPLLRAAGLSRLNVSLDTLRPERFARVALRGFYARVRRGMDAALAAGFAPLKLNVVVIGGVNDDELLDFVEIARDRPIHVRFIEYMPFRGNRWDRRRFVSCRDMRRAIEVRYALRPVEGGEDSAVARAFRAPGFRGGIGFIAAMTDPFCSRCNRLRLTADGSLKTCLFHPPTLQLRDALRAGGSDDELAARIRSAVSGKPRRRPAPEGLAGHIGASMVEIGG